MFHRVDEHNLVDKDAYEADERYIRTVKLYQQSYQSEQHGDAKGFVDTYLQALALQREAQVCRCG